MMKKLIGFLGIILAALFFYYCITSFAPKIQSDILEKAQGSLRDNGLSQSVAAFADGRDVVLDGFVSSETEKQLTEDRIAALDGVRVVMNNLQVKKTEQDMVFDVDDIPAQEMKDTAVDVTLDDPNVDIEVPNMPTDLDIEGFSEMPSLELSVNAPSQVVDGVSQAPATPEMMAQPEQAQTQNAVQDLIAKVSQASLCNELVSEVVAGRQVHFEAGETVIKGESFDLLQNIVTVIDDCKGVSLQIHGHTDNVGDKDLNRKLSHARAKAVGMHLLKSGVVHEVRVFGHGADQPIATNDTDEGRAQNRRIEFKVVALKSGNDETATQQESDAQ